MIALSPRQRDLQEREKSILEVARGILLEKGYYGTTMDGIAQEAGCPKATVYRQFSCKEDIILTLALESVRRRMEMLRRGVAYKGPSRVKLVAIGEAASLFVRLNPNDSSIVHLTMGPLREKGSRHRVSAIEDAELFIVGHVQGLVRQAIVDGDLELSGTDTVERLTYGLISLVEGAYTLMESGVPQRALRIEKPVQEMWWFYNRFADAYGWKPLLADLDWDELLADIRKRLFPEEAERLYGKGNWYGDQGSVHPKLQAAGGSVD